MGKKVIVEQKVNPYFNSNYINVPGYIKGEKEKKGIKIYDVEPISKEDLEKLKLELEKLNYEKNAWTCSSGKPEFSIDAWTSPGKFYVKNPNKFISGIERDLDITILYTTKRDIITL